MQRLGRTRYVHLNRTPFHLRLHLRLPHLNYHLHLHRILLIFDHRPMTVTNHHPIRTSMPSILQASRQDKTWSPYSTRTEYSGHLPARLPYIAPRSISKPDRSFVFSLLPSCSQYPESVTCARGPPPKPPIPRPVVRASPSCQPSTSSTSAPSAPAPASASYRTAPIPSRGARLPSHHTDSALA